METKVIGTDLADVEAVAGGYFDAWFTGDVDQMGRHLHPRLVKRSLAPDGSGPDSPRDRDDMLERTGRGGGTDHPSEDRVYSVEVADVYGDIASVIVRSAIYREYLHLARLDGRWQIVNAFFVGVEPGK